jgi:ADP-heptose:LPS heptosyltransferase
MFDKDVPGRWIETRQLRRHLKAIRLARKHLWSKRFDLAIIPRWDVDYYHATFLAYFSGARWRIGYSESVNKTKQICNRDYDLLLTHTIQNRSPPHEVEHNLNIIRSLNGKIRNDKLELWLSKEDEDFAENILKKHNIKHNDLLICLAPGAGAPKRRWPVTRFAELGIWLQKRYHARVLIIGGAEEKELGNELYKGLGKHAINTVGKTTLRQAAAILKYSHLFIGNDAGPMHMAAAVGAITAAILTQLMYKKVDLTMVLNGALAGLVSVTAAPDTGMMYATIVGFVGAILAVLAVPFFDKLRLDDPVGALSVHLVGGIWGTLAVGIVGNGDFIAQLKGVVVIGAFVFVTSFIVWKEIIFAIPTCFN